MTTVPSPPGWPNRRSWTRCAPRWGSMAASFRSSRIYDADLLCARIDLLADFSRKHGIATTFSPLFDSNASPEPVGIAMDRVRLQAAHGARVTPQMQTRPIDLSFDLTAPMSTFPTLTGWWAMTLLPCAEKLALLCAPGERAKLMAEMDDFWMPIGLQIDFANAYMKRMGQDDAALMDRRVGDRHAGTSGASGGRRRGANWELEPPPRVSAGQRHHAIGHPLRRAAAAARAVNVSVGRIASVGLTTTHDGEAAVVVDEAEYLMGTVEPATSSVLTSNSKYLNSPLFRAVYAQMGLKRDGHDLPDA